MAPFSLITAGVSFLAKSFTVFSCTNTLARCTSVLPASYLKTARHLTAQADGPPKRPMNGYLRYVVQQKPLVTKQHPETKLVDVIRKIAQQWRIMSPEQKRPFEEESQRARELFKVDLQRYQSQLSPAQTEQQALEKRQRMAKRKAIRKKRELNSLGKPKRPRSPFNIFMSEHFEEARGNTTPAKMMSLMGDWRNLLSNQKQVYMQLAEDDKIRYKNEIKSWEDHMVEIGREDLLRDRAQPAMKKKPAIKKKTAATKGGKKAKPKAKAGKIAAKEAASTVTRKTMASMTSVTGRRSTK